MGSGNAENVSKRVRIVNRECPIPVTREYGGLKIHEERKAEKAS